MAGNSSLYMQRQNNINDNIKRWEDWSMSINYVVDQFSDIIGSLQDRLSLAETTIEALKIKIDNMNASYVKLEMDSMQIGSSQHVPYTKTCGVFSNVESGKRNIVYIYSDKTLEGLFVNNVNVKSEQESSQFVPFTQISGSDSGAIVSIKTDDAAKIGGGNVNLYYSLNDKLSQLPYENDSSTSILKLKISYSTAVAKNLVTLDKSELSKAIVRNTVVADVNQPISKYQAPVGQYSSVKTAAAIAKSKADRQ